MIWSHFKNQYLKIFWFGILKSLFSKGTCAICCKSAEYFPGLEKEEEVLRGKIMAIMLIFLLTEGTMSLSVSSSALTSPASVLFFLLLQWLWVKMSQEPMPSAPTLVTPKLSSPHTYEWHHHLLNSCWHLHFWVWQNALLLGTTFWLMDYRHVLSYPYIEEGLWRFSWNGKVSLFTMWEGRIFPPTSTDPKIQCPSRVLRWLKLNFNNRLFHGII